jgi:hypothetical protein
MKRLLLPVVTALIPAASASAGGFEIAGYAGRALPTYQQSFRYSPTLSGLPRGVSVQQEGAFTLDAKGGLAIGGGATWYFAGPLGLEGRVDSVEVKADITGAHFTATATLPPLPPITGSVDFPAGVVSVDRLRPLSLNLKLRTPGPVRLTLSGGASYLPEFKAEANQPVGLGVTGISGGRLQVAAVSLTASTLSTQAGREGRLGANAGVGLQVALGSRLALVAEGRGFLFKKRKVVWNAGTPPRSSLEAALLDEVLKRLEPVEFTPTTYQATAGLALTF